MATKASRWTEARAGRARFPQPTPRDMSGAPPGPKLPRHSPWRRFLALRDEVDTILDEVARKRSDPNLGRSSRAPAAILDGASRLA